jgi:hypothetical protein
MNWCPLKECGRKFSSEATLFDHINRRHKGVELNFKKIREDNLRKLIETTGNLSVDLKLLPKMKKITERRSNSSMNLTQIKEKNNGIEATLANNFKLYSEYFK